MTNIIFFRSDAIENEMVIIAEYKTTNVRVEEEYFIFDTSDIVSGLGGNLGLFLGFSFYRYSNTLSINYSHVAAGTPVLIELIEVKQH